MKYLLILFVLPLWVPEYGTFVQRKKVIIIDAGHGGRDFGAIGVNHSREKDITLAIARAMVMYNRTILTNRYELYLTRYEDTLISLGHRTKLTKVLRPDLFISLHCNHARNVKATGIEVYLHSETSLKTENQKESNRIGLSIIKSLVEKIGYRNRGIKRANFHVLRESISSCPAVLVEFGFLSNNDEASYLVSEKNNRALALAVLMSIKI